MSVAVVFPGQGSQSVGMLAQWNETPVFREVFQLAAEVLGYDLWAVIQEGPEERLNQTEVTQPALLAGSVACWRAIQSLRPFKPSYLAGHSLGEYSALVCAEVLSLADALALVAMRGRLMQEAVPVGAGAMMAILGLEVEQVGQACLEAETVGIVSCANLNTPEQTVIAGERAAVLRAGEIAKALGAKRTILLAVSVPSHCELMRTAAEKMAQALEQVVFQAPVIPVVHNVSALLETDPRRIRALLVSQLYSPVAWTKSIQFLVSQGVTQVYECGPGKVLTGLIRRIAPALGVLDHV